MERNNYIDTSMALPGLAKALCFKLCFTRTFLGKEKATAEVKFEVIFIISKFARNDQKLLFCFASIKNLIEAHQATKKIPKYDPFCFLLNVRLKSISTHSRVGTQAAQRRTFIHHSPPFFTPQGMTENQRPLGNFAGKFHQTLS